MTGDMLGQASPSFHAHSTALVESTDVGPGTRIWAFCHVLSGATIGRDCNIGDHCFIEGGVVLGNEVVLKNGVSLWRGVSIGDRVFVGPGAVFTNDRFPRAKLFRAGYAHTRIDEGASIGANATIMCGLRIGRFAMVGAGAVVTKDVAPYQIVVGNPARPRGFACRCGSPLRFGDGMVVCDCGRRYKHAETEVHEEG